MLLQLELKNTPLSVGSVYPGFVKTEGGLEDGESLCKLSEQNSVQQTGKDLKQLNIENGTYFEATDSARFLCFVLMNTSDEEFENGDWKANDKSLSPRWK